jgi:hypothetical protein
LFQFDCVVYTMTSHSYVGSSALHGSWITTIMLLLS